MSTLKTTSKFKNQGSRKTDLSRSLSLFPTIAIVIGSVIGSGIFVSSAQMARDLKSASLLLTVWVFGGMMTLCGALTQCELVGQMPSTGGLYRYLHEIYGEKIGFMYGWANFAIAGSGAIAAIAFVFASYLSEFVALPHLSQDYEKWAMTIPYVGSIFPLADIGIKSVGLIVIALLTALNVRGVKLGAYLQSVSTSAKVLALILLVGSVFLLSPSQSTQVSTVSSNLVGMSLIGAVVASLSSAFWAYDGWGNVAYIAGEVRDPEKTVPRAIILGTLVFVGLYLLINLAYLKALPIEAIGAAPGDRVASTVMTKVVGAKGALLIALLIMLSTFDTVNSSILTNARVYYAMASDGIFASSAGLVHSKFNTPYRSLIYQGMWAGVLLVSGSFDLVTSMYVFVNWSLYLLQGLGVFVLRFRYPRRHLPFRTPGYPFVPLIFILFSAVFVTLTLVNDVSDFASGKQPIIKSLMGVLLVVMGLPLYALWKKPRKALK